MDFLTSPQFWSKTIIEAFILASLWHVCVYAYRAIMLRIRKQGKLAKGTVEAKVASRQSLEIPDLIKLGVARWIGMNDNDMPAEPIKHIGCATAETSAATWLEGRWFCNITMDLSDWNCLQKLLIIFDEIEPVEAMYTDSEKGVVQLYFRVVSADEMLLYFVDNAPM